MYTLDLVLLSSSKTIKLVPHAGYVLGQQIIDLDHNSRTPWSQSERLSLFVSSEDHEDHVLIQDLNLLLPDQLYLTCSLWPEFLSVLLVQLRKDDLKPSSWLNETPLGLTDDRDDHDLEHVLVDQPHILSPPSVDPVGYRTITPVASGSNSSLPAPRQEFYPVAFAWLAIQLVLLLATVASNPVGRSLVRVTCALEAAAPSVWEF
ncbi:hypothetical protein TorRG33x02_208750 [Trema orientale]|uniref:Uncharacterized protein n=1 Tax=Trema orientale TaxID=63057 RepID=A0A2P5ECP5_TREOI|nr:hypothetical protein TorRG33x02_208750 [Trema orientale]